HLPDRGLRIGSSPPPCAVFPAVHPDVGDIQIYDDGDELTVVLGNFTHGHFANYEDNLAIEQKAEKVTEDVVAFLKALFADQIILWGSHERGGGWSGRSDRSDCEEDVPQYVWSGPLTRPVESERPSDLSDG